MTTKAPDGFIDMMHLVLRLVQRRVTWSEIDAVVANPQKTVAAKFGRTNYFGVVNGRRLRVTVDSEGFVWTVAIAERTV
jgi:hypothetical protein